MWWRRVAERACRSAFPALLRGILRERRVTSLGRRKLHKLEQFAKSLIVIKAFPRRIDLEQSRPAIASLDRLAQFDAGPVGTAAIDGCRCQMVRRDVLEVAKAAKLFDTASRLNL